MVTADRLSLVTAALPTGLPDPVIDSQRIYRAVLDAFSRPGQPCPLPVLPPAPPPLSPSAGAVLLALADLDAPVWLDAAATGETAAAWLRFHSGAPVVGAPDHATFAVIGDAAGLDDLDVFPLGTPEYPDRSATLIVQVAGFADGTTVILRGPGIRGAQRLSIEGLPPAFWSAWEANTALFPQGVDVLFAGPDSVVGLPRTTRATPED